uniref:Uncharacterized protein n=2 Tax=Oryza TaxID=4527 RepID=A0A0E0FZA6_ORYNI
MYGSPVITPRDEKLELLLMNNGWLSQHEQEYLFWEQRTTMRGTPRATAKLIKEAPESLFQFFLDRCSQLQATGTIGLLDFCNAQRWELLE